MPDDRPALHPPLVPSSSSSAPTWRSASYTTIATALDRFRQRTLWFIIGTRSARAARSPREAGHARTG